MAQAVLKCESVAEEYKVKLASFCRTSYKKYSSHNTLSMSSNLSYSQSLAWATFHLFRIICLAKATLCSKLNLMQKVIKRMTFNDK